MSEVKDHIGNQINIGDIVAFGCRRGSSGTIRVRKVIDFNEHKVKVCSLDGGTGGWTYSSRLIVITDMYNSTQ